MTQLKKKLNLKDLFYIFIILVFTVTVSVIDSGYTEEHNESSISMEIGWTDEDGALINLSKLPAGNSVISTELPDQEINDKRLCLKSIGCRSSCSISRIMKHTGSALPRRTSSFLRFL